MKVIIEWEKDRWSRYTDYNKRCLRLLHAYGYVKAMCEWHPHASCILIAEATSTWVRVSTFEMLLLVPPDLQNHCTWSIPYCFLWYLKQPGLNTHPSCPLRLHVETQAQWLFDLDWNKTRRKRHHLTYNIRYFTTGINESLRKSNSSSNHNWATSLSLFKYQVFSGRVRVGVSRTREDYVTSISLSRYQNRRHHIHHLTKLRTLECYGF